ncbi:hypothetical protein K7432_012300 [Basidiobolus ranarum]|uniref:Uncharacterized protein n=1 Tax=Basidiobolus ranarum TaxID=34480 RepID=A0ABR2VSG6_9FUNG
MILPDRSELSLEDIFEGNQEDEEEVLAALKRVLYEDDWDTDLHKVIVVGGSKLQLYKLYSDNGVDSLKLIRHHVSL